MTLFLTSIVCFLFGCAVGAYAMHLNKKSKGYSQLPSFASINNIGKAKPVAESTDPGDPAAYLVRHYRNGDGSTDAYVVCFRGCTDAFANMLHTDPYHEFEVHDYEEYDLPDFGGFEFVYVVEAEDLKHNVVGFMRKEDAESIVETVVRENQKTTFHLVEEE